MTALQKEAHALIDTLPDEKIIIILNGFKEKNEYTEEEIMKMFNISENDITAVGDVEIE